jgi:hypothetical protein
MSKSTLAASEGGHTLRCHDLGVILARHWNAVSDGWHSADVMKEDGWVRLVVAGVIPGGGHSSRESAMGGAHDG